MIGRADIEGSKSNVAMNAWLPQASYPCGNFSDTSSWTFLRPKGSIGHVFTVCIRTENQNQASFSPYSQREISVLTELTLGHLRYCLTDVPPQPNSPSNSVFYVVHATKALKPKGLLLNRISKTTSRVVVFHGRRISHLFYTSWVVSQSQTRVKLNRVFLPHWFRHARSRGCGFTRE